jgi:acetylornithine deacetylase
MTALLDDRALLARLVSFYTVSRTSNLEIVDYLSDYLQRPGVRIFRNPSADGTKTNLLVSTGPVDSARRGLVLSGHLDVVPAEEPDWRSDPFILFDGGDQYVGRGTADMKGFVALAVNRFAALDPAKLLYPLTLLFTYDEEVGTLGARRFTETFHDLDRLPRNVVIGEPTELRVVHAHKGMLRLNITFAGRAAHSGYPQLGASAIEPAARAVMALSRLRQAMETEQQPHSELFPQVPYVALNVGTITGGVAANVIPDRCEIQLGIRLLPGMKGKDVVQRVETAIREVVEHNFTLETIAESPAMMQDSASPVIQLLCHVTGERVPATVMYASDAGWFGHAGFDCVLCGPGSIEVAHQANEYLPVDQFRRAGEMLDRVIHRSCGVA